MGTSIYVNNAYISILLFSVPTGTLCGYRSKDIAKKYRYRSKYRHRLSFVGVVRGD